MPRGQGYPVGLGWQRGLSEGERGLPQWETQSPSLPMGEKRPWLLPSFTLQPSAANFHRPNTPQHQLTRSPEVQLPGRQGSSGEDCRVGLRANGPMASMGAGVEARRPVRRRRKQSG